MNQKKNFHESKILIFFICKTSLWKGRKKKKKKGNGKYKRKGEGQGGRGGEGLEMLGWGREGKAKQGCS